MTERVPVRTRRVAYIECDGCKREVELRQAKTGHLYWVCTIAECHHQVFSRSAAYDRTLASRATRWTDNQVRAELQAGPHAPPMPAAAPARAGNFFATLLED